jgi:hypothetical protein
MGADTTLEQPTPDPINSRRKKKKPWTGRDEAARKR